MKTEHQTYAAEAAGTFLLTFIGSMAVVVYGGGLPLPFGADSLVAIALAHGLALAIAVYALGHISGAHVNPAVTLGFLLVGKIKLPQAAGYLASQFAGAAVAGLAVALLAGSYASSAGFGAPMPAPVISPTQAMAFEAVLTGILVFVVLSTAADKRSAAGWHGFAIGMTLAIAILAGGIFSGGSLNPARSFGPTFASAVFAGLDSAPVGMLWVYFVGPIIGGLLAAWMHKALFSAKG